MTPPEIPWQETHRRALEKGLAGYRDPSSGLWVWTEVAHQQRGECCGSGCRHCPWDTDGTIKR
ncbi:MAG: DUF5522 domain-containing protein [Planctomycetota bacterium]